MPDTNRSSDRIEALQDRIEERPDAVSVGELVQLVEPADVAERRAVATMLDTKVVADPSVAAALLDAVDPLFDHENDDVRRVAATIVEHLAGRHPERAAPAVDRLVELVHDDDPFVRRHAVWALAHVSERAPDVVAPLVSTLRPADDEPVYFEHEHVVTILRNVATADVAAITPLLPALFEALETAGDGADVPTDGVHSRGAGGENLADRFKDGIDVPLTAAELLAEIAETAPRELDGHVDDLVAALETAERRTVRRELATAVGVVAERDPSSVESAIPALAAELDSQDVPLRSQAARTLGLLAADATPAVTDAVAPRIGDLEPMLREGTPPVQASAAGVLSYVAEEDPEIVASLVDALVASLETDDVVVRASAAIALGYAGGEDAKAALSDLVGDDVDPELRGTVEDAIERIESREGAR